MTLPCFFFGHDSHIAIRTIDIPLDGGWRTVRGWVQIEETVLICKRCGKVVK